MITLTVYISDDCNVCKSVVNTLKKYTASKKHLQLKVIDIAKTKNKVTIVPAVFINEKLYSYGKIRLKDLDKKLIS